MRNLKLLILAFQLILIIISFSCNCRVSNNMHTEERIHIINEVQNHTPFEIDTQTGDTVFNIVSFYAGYNVLLIDSLTSIYFHNTRYIGTLDLSNDYIYPPFCNLKPNDLKFVNFPEEIIQVINNHAPKPKWIYLVSNKDTITDPRYFAIKDSLLNQNIHVATRIVTEEEEAVMKSILLNVEYKPKELNWKETYDVYYVD